MAQESFIKGKHDDATHDGAYSNKKRLDESINAWEDWFMDMYGIPLPWALDLAQMDSPLGDKWRAVFTHLSNSDLAED